MSPMKKIDHCRSCSGNSQNNHLSLRILLRTFFSGVFLLLVTGGEALAGEGSAGSGMSLVAAIGLAVASAAVISVIFHRFRQPALLAYIIAGLILQRIMASSSNDSIATMNEVSHLGLVFLLFIIGIEMDLRGIMKLGKGPAAAVLLQAPIAAALILGIQYVAGLSGFSIPGLGSQDSAWFYYAVVVALSSTAVVVKLLGDKFDLNSQAGKITILTLIAQDVWAVLALSYVTVGNSGGDTGQGNPFLMIGGIVAAVAGIILGARFVLSPVLAWLARTPDLLSLVTLGWCFLCAEAVSKTGLSAEMGALLAGLTIGRLPVRVEVLSRVASLRDFFMALFFVSMGIALPAPSFIIIREAVILVMIVLFARILLFTPTMLAAKQGTVVSIASSINLAQISEFSLLLIPAGIMHGALTIHDMSVISYAMMLSVLFSTYAIRYNYDIALLFERLPVPARLKKYTGKGRMSTDAVQENAEIVFLGHHLASDALASKISAEAPELKEKILVIDFYLQNHDRIREAGLNVVYGDISNLEVLRHFGVEKAKVVVCTINDSFLRGTSNQELLDMVKTINPKARVITTAGSRQAVEEFTINGAWACISPEMESASSYLAEIKRALKA